MVEDIGIKKFLWNDYFHDSVISDISFESSSKNKWYIRDTITLTLHCDREYYALPEKERPADWSEFLMNERFTYLMSFCGVGHFEIKNDIGSMEYLNGRFKDTHIVRKLNEKRGRPYYHFRIQLCGGYIDIVFQKFKIRKAVGRVNYFTDYDFTGPKYLDNKYKRSVLPADEVDEFDCFLTMERMNYENDPALAEYARECLKSDMPIEDAKPYAAYILGKVGEKSDLDLVRAFYFEAKDELNELQKRHILDAIELLEAL